MDSTHYLDRLLQAQTLEALESVHDDIFGKQGRLTQQFSQMKTLSVEEKKQLGQQLGDIKQSLTQAYETRYAQLKSQEINQALEQDLVDISTPAPIPHQGSYSLLNHTRRQIEDICRTMGFDVHYGHDMVTKFENFTSLNIPLTHPATEMHDTFFLEDRDESGENYVLRTHMTAMDNSLIKEYGVPLKIAAPSKVYRFENTDASHDTTFYQFEGIHIDKDISIAHLKSFVNNLLKTLLGADTTLRTRPGYFPFVEPGFEIDASCPICHGKGCSLCKNTGRIELLGAGMLHPEVLTQAGVDPETYSGFAFGMGINRLVAIKYRIQDIRLFTNGDLRFSRSFAQELV